MMLPAHNSLKLLASGYAILGTIKASVYSLKSLFFWVFRVHEEYIIWSERGTLVDIQLMAAAFIPGLKSCPGANGLSEAPEGRCPAVWLLVPLSP